MSPEFEQLKRDVGGNTEILNPIVSLEKLEELCKGDEILENLLADALDYSVRYTEDVARFKQVEAQGSKAKESGVYDEASKKRERTHNATIDALNILARNLTKRGRDGSWIDKLGGVRAAYMKLALLLGFACLERKS